MSLTVSVEEFDRALAAGKVRFTRRNQRPVICQCCRQRCLPGCAVRLFVDGHPRGFVCFTCTKGMGE